jgi:hypothetical protein
MELGSGIDAYFIAVIVIAFIYFVTAFKQILHNEISAGSVREPPVKWRAEKELFGPL